MRGRVAAALEMKHPSMTASLRLAYCGSCLMITADKTFARDGSHAIVVLDMEAALAAAQA